MFLEFFIHRLSKLQLIIILKDSLKILRIIIEYHLTIINLLILFFKRLQLLFPVSTMRSRSGLFFIVSASVSAIAIDIIFVIFSITPHLLLLIITCKIYCINFEIFFLLFFNVIFFCIFCYYKLVIF